MRLWQRFRAKDGRPNQRVFRLVSTSTPERRAHVCAKEREQADEDVLQASQEIEENLESKLAQKGEYVAYLEKQITLAKDRNLRKSIQTVSSGVFLASVGYLLYCNYIMLVPHFNAIFMALLVALLSKIYAHASCAHPTCSQIL